MSFKRWLSFGVGGLAAVFLAVGLAGADEPKSGGTLIVGLDSEADFLDNQAAGGWVTWRVNKNMFDALFTEDLTVSNRQVPEIIGELAESWDLSDDGLIWTLNLRKGVKFHDGTDFDAEAVKWNIDRMWNEDAEQFSAKASGCTAFSWQALDRMEVSGTHTIKLIMKTPYGEFLGKQVDGGCGNVSLMSPSNWKKWGNENIGEHPVGTGPFKFVERVRGEKIVMERFDDYWGAGSGDDRFHAPHIDRLIFVPYTDAASRVAALEAGEIDVAMSLPPDSIVRLKEKGFTVAQGPSPHVIYFNLNMKEKCLDDVNYRKAIQYAIDREGIANELLRGTALPAYGFVVPGNASFDPSYQPYPYDPAKAKELIAQSSCPDGGPEMTWLIPTGGSGNIVPVPIAEWVQRNLQEAGFKVNLETYEWQTYLSFWWRGMEEGQSAYWMSWGMTTPIWVEVPTHSKWFAPNGSNVGWYTNDEVDGILDAALSETDDAKRFALYKKAHDRVMDDAAIVPIVHDSTPYVMQPYVKGYVHAPQNWQDFRTVWIDN
jgi:peptide/nickel transport system substrate-binding protein